MLEGREMPGKCEHLRTYEKYVRSSQDSHCLCSIWTAWMRLNSQGSRALVVKWKEAGEPSSSKAKEGGDRVI